MKLTRVFIAATLAVACSASLASAQSAPTEPKPALESPCARPNTELCPERTFYFNNVIQQIDANEIVTALRNTLPPTDKIFLVESENAILVRATPEDLALAQKLIADLDRPKKNYRLTFTVTELDGSKQIGTEHYAMIMTSGQATTLKLGSKIPVATGSYSAGGSTPAGVQTQFSYVDVGMNFDATLTEMGNNAMLKSSVEQSSVAPETSEVAGAHEPIIRQASLRGETFLTPGKPVALGSMDIPGSTSRLQIEVLMEPLP
jgi:type II secretory pathway component GspD/PulD (secretin)